MRRLFLYAAALLVAAAPVSAGLAEKKGMTLDAARRVLAAARDEAKRLGAPGGALAVVDEGGNLVAVERLDGTFAAGANISIGKARTAAMFQRPTKVFEEIIRGGRTAMVALPDFTPLQGGVPIVVDGQVVGAIGVSGAASADQDTQIAEAGARALASPSAPAVSGLPVSFFDRDHVARAFAQGAVLFDGQGRHYMIHASRRTAPGQAEVHTGETDIVYVQDGTATLVTGGSVLEGRSTGPGEIRGAGIRGGEPRRLRKGDVIIIPAGTPHWFRDVDGVFTYYVVKVR